MKYYKDNQGSIYTGDKADYRDKKLTQTELDIYNIRKLNKKQIKIDGHMEFEEAEQFGVY